MFILRFGNAGPRTKRRWKKDHRTKTANLPSQVRVKTKKLSIDREFRQETKPQNFEVIANILTPTGPLKQNEPLKQSRAWVLHTYLPPTAMY